MRFEVAIAEITEIKNKEKGENQMSKCNHIVERDLCVDVLQGKVGSLSAF